MKHSARSSRKRMRRPPTCARSWIANWPRCPTCTGPRSSCATWKGCPGRTRPSGWAGRRGRSRAGSSAPARSWPRGSSRLGLAIPAAGLGVVATASAAVPAALAESTVRIGVLVAAGEAVAVAAAPVAALMEGVMKAMLLTKLKGMATVVVISCAVLATSVAGWRANAVGASADTGRRPEPGRPGGPRPARPGQGPHRPTGARTRRTAQGRPRSPGPAWRNWKGIGRAIKLRARSAPRPQGSFGGKERSRTRSKMSSGRRDLKLREADRGRSNDDGAKGSRKPRARARETGGEAGGSNSTAKTRQAQGPRQRTWPRS